MTRIYTRGGDAGKTSLGDGSRVSKLDLRIAPFRTVGELNANGHGPRFEAITDSDEDVLLEAGIHDRVTRHGQDVVTGGFKGRRPIQAGLQRAAGVSGGHSDAERARAHRRLGAARLRRVSRARCVAAVPRQCAGSRPYHRRFNTKNDDKMSAEGVPIGVGSHDGPPGSLSFSGRRSSPSSCRGRRPSPRADRRCRRAPRRPGLRARRPPRARWGRRR